jgi:hypothetical protein
MVMDQWENLTARGRRQGAERMQGRQGHLIAFNALALSLICIKLISGGSNRAAYLVVVFELPALRSAH